MGRPPCPGHAAAAHAPGTDADASSTSVKILPVRGNVTVDRAVTLQSAQPAAARNASSARPATIGADTEVVSVDSFVELTTTIAIRGHSDLLAASLGGDHHVLVR